MAKKKEPPRFHNPFQAAREQLAKAIERPPPPAAAPPPTARTVAPGRSGETRDPEELFAEQMLGVAPLEPDRRGRIGAPDPSPRPVSRRAEEDAEAYATLADLVDGSGPFSISETDEYLEFLAPGLDRRILRRLRKGDYALQGHIDLHGMTREEAYRAVEQFVAASRTSGKRCVLIIHGRGLHSKEEIPVLKEQVKRWLERGRIARSVLAFTSARPCDGGTGALYVLLRR